MITRKIIPQCNPKANYVAHKMEIDAAIKTVLNSGVYILGNEVKSFEKEFASYFEAKHAISVANGTEAIEIALRACGIGYKDYVITVSHTASATVSAICATGAKPLFVDIESDTFNMSPKSLSNLLQKTKNLRIRAVIPVHLYGNPANLFEIIRICKKHKIFVIEDCAQAHGANIGGKKVGTFGDLGTFSFYPTKNLAALGDGGMIITNKQSLAEKLILLRQYGWKKRHISHIIGSNSRLDEIQAAILRVKIKYLYQENLRRKEIADKYSEGLKNLSLILPSTTENAQHAYHQYVIKHRLRNFLKRELEKKGIQTLIHYPVPLHKQAPYAKMPEIVSLDNTEEIVSQILSLPMYPELTNKEVSYVVDAIRKIIGGPKF